MTHINFIASMLLLSTSFITQATPMHVTVNGVITDSFNLSGNTFGFGAGDGTLIGKNITQLFTYDTSTAVYDTSGGNDPKSISYSSQIFDPLDPARGLSGSWISVRTFIDGILLPEPDETPSSNSFPNNVDGLSFYNHYDPASNLLSQDIVGISSSSMNISTVNDNTIYTYSQSTLSLEKLYSDLITGFSLNQEFSIDTSSHDYFSYAYATVNKSIIEVTPNGSNTISSFNFKYYVHTATFESATRPVPLPHAFLLMLSGLLLAYLPKFNVISCNS